MIRPSLLALAFALVSASCAGNGSQKEPAHPAAGAPTTSNTPSKYSGRLITPSQFPHDFSWRQEITARYGKEQHAFSAVLEKSGNTVTVVGLTPFGTRAFVLTQDGQTVRFEKFVDRELGLDPRSILVDVHRAYFRWLPDAPHPDGVHTGTDDGEQVTETWRHGKLIERTFRRSGDASSVPPLHIVFHGGALPGQVTGLVTLTNGWYGYELELRTVEAQGL
jgi:hypothetical protein